MALTSHMVSSAIRAAMTVAQAHHAEAEQDRREGPPGKPVKGPAARTKPPAKKTHDAHEQHGQDRAEDRQDQGQQDDDVQRAQAEDAEDGAAADDGLCS